MNQEISLERSLLRFAGGHSPLRPVVLADLRPGGERALIRSKGLEHTSMSVGNVIVSPGNRVCISSSRASTRAPKRPSRGGGPQTNGKVDEYLRKDIWP